MSVKLIKVKKADLKPDAYVEIWNTTISNIVSQISGKMLADFKADKAAGSDPEKLADLVHDMELLEASFRKRSDELKKSIAEARKVK